MTENTSSPIHPRLQEVLSKSPGKIIIEGGHKNIFSTDSRKNPDTLVIGVDPQVPQDRIINPNTISVHDTLGGVRDQLSRSADVVLLVAPSPYTCIQMVEEAEDLIATDGKIVAILDTTSNQRDLTSEVIQSLDEIYGGSEEYSVRKKRILDEEDLPGILRRVTGLKISPKSEISLNSSIVVVIKKKI